MYNTTSSGLQINGDDSSSSVGSADEDLFREITERVEIVEKYEKPNLSLKQMDFESENLQMEYDSKDRYGFYHEGPSFQDDASYLQAREKEMKRIKKWQHMKRKYQDDLSKLNVERARRPDIRHDTIKLHPKFGFRVWKGIPQRFRPWAWQLLLHVEPLMTTNVGVYKELVERAKLVCKDVRQIDLDINRTYRNHELFKDRYSSQQKSMLEVLSAYAIYNKEVGYCQGMNQIAAMLLIFLGDAEVAFWGLHRLMTDDKYRMHGFFKPGFPKLIRFQQHLDKILSKYFSRLKRHIDKQGIPQIYSTKWFFGCFLDRVPLQLALRVWDIYLMKGECILIAMAYTLFKMHSSLLKRMNMEEFLEYVQSTLAVDFGYPDDDVIKVLYDSMRKLKNDKMLYPPLLNPGDESISDPFGSVLTQNFDKHRHISLVIQSRKTSRAPSISASLATSPKLEERKFAGESVSDSDEDQTGVRRGAQPQRATRSTSPIARSAPTAQRPYSPTVTPATPLTSTPKAASQGAFLPDYDRGDVSFARDDVNYARDDAVNMKNAPSFYDNVPDSQYPQRFTESDLKYEKEKFRNADGTLTILSKMERVQTEVETKLTHTLVDGKPMLTGGPYTDAHTSTAMQNADFIIRRGPDNITNIIIEPEYNHAHKSSPTRRFPVTHDDYYSATTQRERQTIV